MHIMQGCIPIVVSNPLGRLRKRYPMHALPDGQRHPCVKIRQVLATRFASPFHVFFAFFSLRLSFFLHCDVEAGLRLRI